MRFSAVHKVEVKEEAIILCASIPVLKIYSASQMQECRDKKSRKIVAASSIERHDSVSREILSTEGASSFRARMQPPISDAP